jgi:hypothetical protein
VLGTGGGVNIEDRGPGDFKLRGFAEIPPVRGERRTSFEMDICLKARKSINRIGGTRQRSFENM